MSSAESDVKECVMLAYKHSFTEHSVGRTPSSEK